MNEAERQAEFDREFERLLELPPGTDREPLLRALPSEEQDEMRRMLAMVDLAWAAGHGAPPIEDDPVAAMLGLIPDPNYQLDPGALKRARTRANVKPAGLAAALTRRGWSVSAGDIFLWERHGDPSLSPALVRAVAEELHTGPDALSFRGNPGASLGEQGRQAVARKVAGEVAESSRFKDLVQRYATWHNTSVGLAGSVLQSRMLATVHRGEHPTADQMLSGLEAFLSALEADQTDQPER